MMAVRCRGEKHKSGSLHPTSRWSLLSRVTLSHSARQQNNANGGRDQSALSLHHPHATSLQFFTAAMNSAEREEKTRPFLRRRGPDEEHPPPIVWLKSLTRRPPPLFSCPSTLIPAHWRPLDWDIKHSMKVTFIDLFELIFTYKLASNLREKRFSVGPLSHRVMAFPLYGCIVGVPQGSMVGLLEKTHITQEWPCNQPFR